MGSLVSAWGGHQFLVSFFYAGLRVLLVVLSERALGRYGSVEVGQGGEVAVPASREEDLPKGLLIVEHLSEVLISWQRRNQQPRHFLRIHLVLELLLLLYPLHDLLLLQFVHLLDLSPEVLQPGPIGLVFNRTNGPFGGGGDALLDQRVVFLFERV